MTLDDVEFEKELERALDEEANDDVSETETEDEDSELEWEMR